MLRYMRSIRFWGMIGLLLGNAIGAGMLALPIAVGLSGFFPTLFRLALLSVMSVFAAFVLIEESEGMPQPVFDSPTILKKAFAVRQRPVVSVLLYVFFSTLLAAYIVGGSSVIGSICEIEGNPVWLRLAFGLALALLTSFGIGFVESCNAPLTVLIVLSLVFLVTCCFMHADYSHVIYADQMYSCYTMPVLASAIGFNYIVPTMYLALDRDGRQLRFGIVIAHVLLAMMVLTWTLAVIVAVPRVNMPADGALLAGAKQSLGECRSLLSAQYRNIMITVPMANIMKSSAVTLAGLFFSLFALATSFFGVGISVRGSVRDVLANVFGRRNVFLQILLSFGPALIITSSCPDDFLGIMNHVCGPLYTLLFVMLPMYLAIRNPAGSRCKRFFGALCFIFAIVAMLLSVGKSFGWLDVRSAAETECRSAYAEDEVRQGKPRLPGAR